MLFSEHVSENISKRIKRKIDKRTKVCQRGSYPLAFRRKADDNNELLWDIISL